MRAAAAVGVARRIDERRAVELRGNGDVEGKLLRRDHRLLLPRHAAIERAVEGDGVRGVVVPGEIELAIRTDEGAGADGAAWSLRIVGAGGGERRAMVAGARPAHAAAARAAARGIPGDVDAVAERAAGIRVGGDHRLVVEVIAAAGEVEEGGLRIALAAGGGAVSQHLGAVDAVAVAEEDDDRAVEEISLRVEG